MKRNCKNILVEEIRNKHIKKSVALLQFIRSRRHKSRLPLKEEFGTGHETTPLHTHVHTHTPSYTYTTPCSRGRDLQRICSKKNTKKKNESPTRFLNRPPGCLDPEPHQCCTEPVENNSFPHPPSK